MSFNFHKQAVLLLCVSAFSTGYAQEGKFKKFLGLSAPEKRWVYAHPFIAVKTLKISEKASKVSKEQESSTDLDGHRNGGQIDAFRHCYWMASLCMEIKEQKALKLGIAHEEGNEKDFKKRKDEDGDLPDAISNTMDLWNNQVGASLSRKGAEVSEEDLLFIVKTSVVLGQCRIIKRNAKGDFLDQQGNIIPRDAWYGKWVNSRCLVPSDKTSN